MQLLSCYLVCNSLSPSEGKGYTLLSRYNNDDIEELWETCLIYIYKDQFWWRM